mmetsp:Transcript_29835/g.50388  ORF Transcript_29835/g.50388 Transcript_29835/m.50388 type:complete len:364 (+) Transcript_29835:69-1160(+)
MSQTGRGIYLPPGRRLLNEKKSHGEKKTAEATNVSCAENNNTGGEWGGNVEVSSEINIKVNLPAHKSAPTNTASAPSAVTTAGKRPNREESTDAGGERQIYVPRGRRELNEKKILEAPAVTHSTAEDNNKDDLLHDDGSASKRSARERSGRNGLTGVTAGTGTIGSGMYTSWDDDEDQKELLPPANVFTNVSIVSEDTVAESCLVLGGVPDDMTDMGRSNIVRVHVAKGATIKWIGRRECLMAFKNSKIASISLQAAGSGVYSICKLSDVDSFHRRELMSAAREMYNELKPAERDNRVANRLIGAALGIQLPKQQQQQQQQQVAAGAKTGTRTAGTRAVARGANRSSSQRRSPSPPRVDAWDD